MIRGSQTTVLVPLSPTADTFRKRGHIPQTDSLKRISKAKRGHIATVQRQQVAGGARERGERASIVSLKWDA